MKAPGQLIKSVSAVSLLAFVVLSYVDIVYLPQKKTLDEQNAALAALAGELRALRAEQRDNEALKKRVHVLEGALNKLLPSTGPGAGAGRKPSAPQQPPSVPGPRPPASAPAPPPPPGGAKGAAAKARQREVKWRSDDKCGADSLVNGRPAECNPEGSFPCCAPSGWCGASHQHCTCHGCIDYRSASFQSDAALELASYKEESNKTIALVIPFRDRGVHLERFRERIQAHADSWKARGIGHTWVVFVVEQFDNALFNRGWLFNAGFHFSREYAQKTGKPFDCVVMQDIDLLPEPTVDYGWCVWPMQLSGEIECWSWSVPYPDNVGGVTSLSPKHWTAINGFSNEYEGWGGEDDDLYLRLKNNGLLKGNCHTWCGDRKPPTVPMVYRPKLGRGRFGCLHDGDHTPRQRAPNDAPMWSRLNAMKANSQRWRTDGISSLNFHSAGPAVWSRACEGSCSAAEDPVARRRLFSEMWVRVSSKPISSPQRVTVQLNMVDAQCSLTTRPLTSLPAGLESLRMVLAEMFQPHCGNDTSWVHRTSFLLVDAVVGQALVVGEGNPLVMPDSSLPSLPSPGEPPQPPPATASEHLMQGQHLSRWLRKLPESHHGWLLATGRPAVDVRQGFIDEGRRVPLTSPVCISQTAFDGSRKFRATPGTRWCGDGGWTHSEYFLALRSKSSAPEDQLVPICISYNSRQYTYRFEQSEDGCVGKHAESDTTWKHAHTIHTLKQATGEQLCVGMRPAGEKTRWMLLKKPRCDVGGFLHVFDFRAMAEVFRPPLAVCCLLAAESEPSGGQAVRRLATLDHCRTPPAPEPGFSAWRKAKDVTLLARRRSSDDVRICPAEGLHETERLWRVFRGEACAKAKLSTRETGGHKVQWQVQQEPELYVPQHATGVQLVLCRTPRRKPPGFQYSWFEGGCTDEGKKELSFHEVSIVDSMEYVHLIDDIT